MEYKGIKLTEVTESQIVDPPKKMLVWDYDSENLLKEDVLAIVNGRDSGFPVITKTGTYRHCTRRFLKNLNQDEQQIGNFQSGWQKDTANILIRSALSALHHHIVLMHICLIQKNLK